MYRDTKGAMLPIKNCSFFSQKFDFDNDGTGLKYNNKQTREDRLCLKYSYFPLNR